MVIQVQQIRISESTNKELVNSGKKYDIADKGFVELYVSYFEFVVTT